MYVNEPLAPTNENVYTNIYSNLHTHHLFSFILSSFVCFVEMEMNNLLSFVLHFIIHGTSNKVTSSFLYSSVFFLFFVDEKNFFCCFSFDSRSSLQITTRKKRRNEIAITFIHVLTKKEQNHPLPTYMQITT